MSWADKSFEKPSDPDLKQHYKTVTDKSQMLDTRTQDNDENDAQTFPTICTFWS